MIELTTHQSNDKSTTTIKISGRFDFNLYNAFRDAYEEGLDNGSTRFIIDFAQTEYMDSSALGMLLVLRECCGGNNASIHLTNCNIEIKNILAISNFDKLFNID